jgi:hypothetical protein
MQAPHAPMKSRGIHVLQQSKQWHIDQYKTSIQKCGYNNSPLLQQLQALFENYLALEPGRYHA